MEMLENARPSIQIDLNEFKLHLHLTGKSQLTLHFNSPSRSFYLSLIALAVNEMKRSGRIKAVSPQEHLELIMLLNESIGGAAGSSEKANLLNRIYVKWKDALPNLEDAPLFKVLGRKKEEGDGNIGKVYSFTDEEKDAWANVFGYIGSRENVRLKFAIDKIGVALDDISIIFGDFRDGKAWNQFTSSLKKVASLDRMKYPLPDAPSIAVMPFVNMSEDPKQEILCDAMTEEIITALSKIPGMFVIARNSTFVYKGKPVTVKRVSEELGVQYVLEGSLQRSGGRLRITAQLIDALTGVHLWAERYDRDLTDIFTLQDEITMKILTGVKVNVTGLELSSNHFKGKQGLDCYLKLAQAHPLLLRWNILDNNIARRIIEEAIGMCPENPWGYIYLGWVYQHDYWFGTTTSPQETLEKGLELGQKAISMDDSISGAHTLLCWMYLLKKQHDQAIAAGERAVSLDPGGTHALNVYAACLVWAGRPEEAIPLFQRAIRLNPLYPNTYLDLGVALRVTGHYEEACSAYKKGIQLSTPDSILAHIGLTITYSMMGREREARAEAAEVIRINPKFSLDKYARVIPYKDPSEAEKTVQALRKAGLK